MDICYNSAPVDEMSTDNQEVSAALREALESRSLRFFRASRGSAKGKTGTKDTEKFAETLMVLQECALLLGEKLEMNAVAHAICYEEEETSGFAFDPNSDPHNPEVVGAIVNRRMPMREFASSLRDFINE